MDRDRAVLERYADAARRAEAGDTCDGCSDGPFGVANYDDLDDLPTPPLQVSLGCGNPVAVADLRPGEIVLDLGSGGGIDVLLSARRVGPTGFAYGLDATVEMVDLARRNAAEAGATNVEFLHGTIEEIPLAGRQRRRRHLELRHRPVGRQGRHVRRARPRAASRRSGRDQRHRPRRPRRRHTDHASRAATPPSRRRLRRRPAPRRPRPPSRSSSPTRSAPASPTRSSAPPSPRSAIRAMTTRTGRPCGTSTRPGSPPATPPSRPSRPGLGPLGRQPPRRPPPRRHRRRRIVVGWAALSPVSDRCVVRRCRREQPLHPPRPPRPRHRHPAPRRPRRRGRNGPATGRSRPASSPRTPPASPPTSAAGSASSDDASASASSTACGATRCSSNVAAPASDVHETTGTFDAHDGLRLCSNAAGSPTRTPRAIVAILHGGGEHSGRYHHVAERLTAAGFRVDAFDQRSHGRSERVRGVALQCDDADHLLDDTARLARPSGRRRVPLFVIGHSMGGLVATALAADRRLDVAGLDRARTGAAHHTSTT